MATSPDLSYLADDLRPEVQDYLDKMRDLANRAWREHNAGAHSLAMRCYYAALGKIQNHQWPL